jgi:hypothetical protein
MNTSSLAKEDLDSMISSLRRLWAISEDKRIESLLDELKPGWKIWTPD